MPRSLPVLLAVALTTSACVGKRKYDVSMAENATLAERIARLEDDLGKAEARIANLTEQRDVLEQRAEALDALAAEFDARNDALSIQLGQLEGALSKMSARSAADQARKDDLEAALAEMSASADSARANADAARARMASIEAEVSALRAEKEKLQEKTAAYDDLVSSLQAEIEAGTVAITELQGKLTVNLSNAILFDSGKYAVKDDGRAALKKVAGVLATIADREIRVEGHTDDVPVNKGAAYADNWALSSLRASSVVALLVADGVDPSNIAAVGYGDRRPLVPNTDDASRASNRRTEIVLVPRLMPLGGTSSTD